MRGPQATKVNTAGCKYGTPGCNGFGTHICPLPTRRNMSTNTIAFHSVKGGAGCTTVAALFAMQMHRAGHDVHLSTAGSRDDLDDVATIFALPGINDYRIVGVRPGFTMGTTRSLPDPSDAPYLGDLANVVQVIDVGTRHSWTAWPVATTATVLVTRTDFLSLRRLTGALSPERLNGTVVLEDPNWPLDNRDVASVLGRPVLEVFPCDARFQRHVDSGLLVNDRAVHDRVTADLFPTLRRLITVPLVDRITEGR